MAIRLNGGAKYRQTVLAITRERPPFYSEANENVLAVTLRRKMHRARPGL
jgi:hypothetical protein